MPTLPHQSRSKLPVGIQTFSEIREGGYYYVDKTHYIESLATQNKYYFLSRPRRFGKSLLLDTLRCLFEGQADLFEGLSIYDRWDWSQIHPVVRLSFGSGVMRNRAELDLRIRTQLRRVRHDLNLAPGEASDIAGEFLALIEDVHAKFGRQVVVLIDEYDKPILDNITDSARATELREGLKNLYSTLKDADAHLRMVFLTGVSKFTKVSLFSGLNNLRDITLLPQYATICGYTDEDIDTVFSAELVDIERDAIRQWYNGYRWGDQEIASVYNPFDVLLLFQNREFGSYWFESATPTFLVNLLKQRGVFTPAFDAWQTNYSLLSQFDVEDMSTDALLFQAGYLTIKQIEEPLIGVRQYTLGLPNKEVQAGLNESLLPALGIDNTTQKQRALLDVLLKHDLQGLQSHLKALYAGLPHDWYQNNPIARYEGHYASVFYSHFAALGLNVTVEDASNYGRVDMTVDVAGHIYLFEFKVLNTSAEAKSEAKSDAQIHTTALAQILARGYADKYRASGKPIHLIGVEFSSDKREIVMFDVHTIHAS